MAGKQNVLGALARLAQKAETPALEAATPVAQAVGPVKAVGALQQAEKVGPLFRGVNSSGLNILNGIAKGRLFVTPYEDVARAYAGSDGWLLRFALDPEAKVLREGTREFAALTKRRPGKLMNTMRAGENLKSAADDAVQRAVDAGYHAVEFNSLRDLGTVILDTSKLSPWEP